MSQQIWTCSIQIQNSNHSLTKAIDQIINMYTYKCSCSKCGYRKANSIRLRFQSVILFFTLLKHFLFLLLFLLWLFLYISSMNNSKYLLWIIRNKWMISFEWKAYCNYISHSHLTNQIAHHTTAPFIWFIIIRLLRNGRVFINRWCRWTITHL